MVALSSTIGDSVTLEIQLSLIEPHTKLKEVVVNALAKVNPGGGEGEPPKVQWETKLLISDY